MDADDDALTVADVATVQPLGPDRTVEQQLTRQLRSSILEGVLAPGMRLPYRDLARQFGVSVTPVRVALRELAKEGLIELSPHGGAYVSPLSVTELEELFATRTGIESWLARLGAERLTDEDLEVMEHLYAEVEVAVAAADAKAYLDRAWAFRLVCYRASGRPLLAEKTVTLFNQSARYTSFSVMTTARIEESFRSLRKFKAACEVRDGRLAQQTIQDALERTFEYLAEHLPELGRPA